MVGGSNQCTSQRINHFNIFFLLNWLKFVFFWISFFYFFKDKDSDEPPKVAVIVGEPCDKKEDSVDKNVDLVYAINDKPPWYLCILLGFQVKHTSVCNASKATDYKWLQKLTNTSKTKNEQ